MSFILDALKKSETDRQRQNGPALFEVKVAPSRNGLPLWAVGLGVLLAVNLVIVAWVLLRRPAQAEPNAAQGTQSFQTASYSDRGGGPGDPSQNGRGAWQGGQSWQGQPAGQSQNWQGGQPAGQGQNWQGGQPAGQGQNWQGGQPAGQGQNWQGGQPGQGQNWQGGQPGQGGQAWGAQQPDQGGGYSGGTPGTVAGGAPQGQQMVPTGGSQAAGPAAPGGFNGATDAGGERPDDYAPAADPPQQGASFGNRVARGTASGVPLYQDAALQPGTRLPELRLDLHVFAALPQNRFVMINMHKLHEGDSLPEGVRVESIIPEGAVLSKDGTRFLLPRQ